MFDCSSPGAGASGVEIVSTSAAQQEVRAGEELDLYCESATPYQWCYWAHGGAEYPTTSHKGGGEVRWAWQPPAGHGTNPRHPQAAHAVGVRVAEVQHAVRPPPGGGGAAVGGGVEVSPGQHGLG